MGASTWVYYTPYQEDIARAFQSLRQHIFKTDEEFKDDAHGPSPRTIREILEESEGAGTHTAMDLESLSTRPRDFSVVPLPGEVLGQFLAETKPGRAVIEGLVFQHEFWHQLHWEEKLAYSFHASEETRSFAQSSPSKEELVEALLTNEQIWLDSRQLIMNQIEYLVNQTRTGEMIPFSVEELVRLFGSEQPTRAAVEPALDEVWDRLYRWSGFYIVIYQDGMPYEIAFVGVSGD